MVQFSVSQKRAFAFWAPITVSIFPIYHGNVLFAPREMLVLVFSSTHHCIARSQKLFWLSCSFSQFFPRVLCLWASPSQKSRESFKQVCLTASPNFNRRSWSQWHLSLKEPLLLWSEVTQKIKFLTSPQSFSLEMPGSDSFRQFRENLVPRESLKCCMNKHWRSLFCFWCLRFLPSVVKKFSSDQDELSGVRDCYPTV